MDYLRHSWKFHQRPEQATPSHNPKTSDGRWAYWLFLAGRGSGKTRSGAEWVRENICAGRSHGALVAPTAADARDVMVDGPAGLMSVCWKHDRDINGNHLGIPLYEPSRRRVTWASGAFIHTYSAEEPDRLRGPQHQFLWADELAAWQYPNDAWDMAMFGLRLGQHPQAMISTTPRPIPIIRELVRDPQCVITRASTYENYLNLAASFFGMIVKKYEGTRLGKQELLGEVVEEAEGALWTRAMVDAAHWPLHKPLPDMRRVVVAIDPAITENPTSNLTGIVAAGLGVDGRGYVLADVSGRYLPAEWARRAIELFDKLGGDKIIAEGNQGGSMVRHTLNTVRKDVPVNVVHASRSKQARAEPVSALYEQKRVSHAIPFVELEDQLCTWQPLSGEDSPDRLDALVWALTALFLTGQRPTSFPVAHVTGTARNIPGQ